MWLFGVPTTFKPRIFPVKLRGLTSWTKLFGTATVHFKIWLISVEDYEEQLNILVRKTASKRDKDKEQCSCRSASSCLRVLYHHAVSCARGCNGLSSRQCFRGPHEETGRSATVQRAALWPEKVKRSTLRLYVCSSQLRDTNLHHNQIYKASKWSTAMSLTFFSQDLCCLFTTGCVRMQIKALENKFTSRIYRVIYFQLKKKNSLDLVALLFHYFST
jgi:hypothetical protein